MPFSPPEEELTQAVIDLKSSNPQLGISKVHALLLRSYPDWVVSEKRTRKVLQSQGLIVSPTPSFFGIPEPAVYPSSSVIHSLDVHQWSAKIDVKYFNKKKGKGLVAISDIEEGETVWREDPFIIAPEWEIFDMQQKSTACSYCTTPLLPDSPLVNPCTASSSSSYCPARFCNRLCTARSGKTHPLVCPVQNPASVPLIKYAKDIQWMALHALTQCTSRILQANQLKDPSTLNSDWEIVTGLAELGLEDRFKYSFKSAASPEPDRPTWQKAFKLYIEAFKEPKSPQAKKKLDQILKNPLPAHIDAELFSYEGFLRGLGRMSLNLEAHGGLYAVHSHLNHSCDPNISVRHLDQRNSLSRITVIAKRPIKAGEELLVTYVNPKLGFKARQDELKGWGFGACICSRCVEEAKMISQAPATNDELDDLESELKAGLGVV
ncbi:SET domain-containing protein [Gymnopilus junonius]|uniref:Histone-lysine N-methyltransferase SET5 n=1 Tax=Gymnopilus junonius TaxID=109634 RepID=A0A9P5TM14_GYMJU|nr:SET domain-containing protein [Gymnopilus junonius]